MMSAEETPLFLVGSTVPHAAHGRPGVTAAHIVFYELVAGLARQGHEIVLQCLLTSHRRPGGLNSEEKEALRTVESLGVRVLPPIDCSQYQPIARPRSLLMRAAGAARGLLDARLDIFYPTLCMRGTVSELVRASGARAVVTVWSPEGVAATHGLSDVPRIAYHGDVDFVPAAVRLRDRVLFGNAAGAAQLWLAPLRQGIALREFRRAHLRLMRRVQVIANVTASNAEYYRANGHPRSVYVRNLWTDSTADAASRLARPRDRAAPTKIIGHVGYLNRTGSTYGLRYLLEEIVPLLRTRMAPRDYAVHIIGGGAPVPAVKRLMEQERVLGRGFVDDLNQELDSSDVVLLLNNVGPYQAAYSRHLVAWSLGVCLVVHANSQRAMPEIVHGQNALVGSTPREIADLVHLAVTNREVNLRVRKGGRATFEQYFTPDRVAAALSAEIRRSVA